MTDEKCVGGRQSPEGLKNERVHKLNEKTMSIP